MELKSNDKVTSAEWAENSVGTVMRLIRSRDQGPKDDTNPVIGAAIQVQTPMKDFIVEYVIRTEWWPVSDWEGLKPL